MKTIGLLGGMSWESTVPYYRTINRVVAERLGGLHSAEIVLWSVDFHRVEELQRSGRWRQAGELLAAAAARLEGAGAELLVIATNTMHRVAPRVETAVGIPLLHIADATAAAVRDAGVGTVGLLGTRFTMEERFYRERLERHGLGVLVPPADDRAMVDRVIYDELCRGQIRAGSQSAYRQVVDRLAERGAEGIILGCTEIGLLLDGVELPVPSFDTAHIHARAAALWSLGETSAPAALAGR